MARIWIWRGIQDKGDSTFKLGFQRLEKSRKYKIAGKTVFAEQDWKASVDIRIDGRLMQLMESSSLRCKGRRGVALVIDRKSATLPRCIVPL